MKNLAIITARSGSKGLHDKNIRPLNGKPLIAYSIEAANDSGLFDEVMVSTDSELYAEISRKNGANVPFLRSVETSSDNAGSWDVVKEVLSMYLKLGKSFDTVCLLQPTSPLRTASDIQNGYEYLQKMSADAITAVCPVDHSPLWTMKLPEDNNLAEYRNSSKDVPRQLLGQFYRVNGALYIRKVEYKECEISIIDKSEYAIIMDRNRSVDIDTIEDFEYAEWLLTK